MQSRRELQQSKKSRSFSKSVTNTLIVILILLAIGVTFFFISNQPRAAARRQAVSIAKKYAKLKDPGQFYIYNRESTYYTIVGKNNKNQNILVIVPQHSGDIRVLKQSSGLTAKEAMAVVKKSKKPSKILKAAPGVFNNKVVWEVTYQNSKGNLCYDLINFKSGKIIQEINNL